MFERYTEKARRMIFFARYEASQLGSPSIETEHLLLGLFRADVALSLRFLGSHAGLESIRKQINEQAALRERISTSVDIPVSDEGKQVLALAAEEAQRLGHSHIGTEHLLLGLLREEKGVAAQILRERGLRLDDFREELERALAEIDTEAQKKQMRAETPQRLLSEGVTIERLDTCVIDPLVEVGTGTVIEPYVQLLGKTIVGAGCRIRSFSVIENCTLGERVLVRQHCVLEDSAVADGAQIGPFAHLRPGSEIGEDAHVGNFVETKKAKLGKGAKANHLTYLGDAEIGDGANIGAGTITCNYDGVNKHRTRIGKGAFVGSDSTLVAPITVGDGAYIGAGSCITKDVPSDALAVARGRQMTKEGWAAARRGRREAKP